MRSKKRILYFLAALLLTLPFVEASHSFYKWVKRSEAADLFMSDLASTTPTPIRGNDVSDIVLRHTPISTRKAEVSTLLESSGFQIKSKQSTTSGKIFDGIEPDPSDELIVATLSECLICIFPHRHYYMYLLFRGGELNALKSYVVYRAI